MANKGIGRGRGGKGGDRHSATHGPRQPFSMKRGGPGGPAGGQGRGKPGAAGVEKPGYEAFKPHYKPKTQPPREFDARGPARDARGPARDARGPARDARVPARDARGPGRDARGPVRDARGPVRRAPLPEKRPEAALEPVAREHAPRGSDDKVMGINPVLELLRSGTRPVDALYIDKDKGGKQFGELVSLARKKGISVKVVPRTALDKMSGELRHQGALAVVSPKEYADPYALVEKAVAKGGLPLFLILDGVEDPQNLGAVIRTAEASGVDGVIIPEHRAAHLSSAVARASAGALEHMPVAKTPNIVGFIGFLKEQGFWVLGLAGESGQDYTAFDMKGPLAVILGGEGPGIRPLVRKSCDALVSLPMLGKVSSLNVSVAAGIILYEIVRQRRIR